MAASRTQKAWRVQVPGRTWSGAGKPLALLEVVCQRYRLWRAGLVEGRDYFVEWRSPHGGGWTQLLPDAL